MLLLLRAGCKTAWARRSAGRKPGRKGTFARARRLSWGGSLSKPRGRRTALRRQRQDPA